MQKIEYLQSISKHGGLLQCPQRPGNCVGHGSPSHTPFLSNLSYY